MLTIGDFARLSGLSVRMLHHYDTLGLLRPDRVDPFSGYRYYAVETLQTANRIVALKELGFGLEQTRTLLGATPDELRPLLRDRAGELRAQIDADRHRLAEVEARLRLLEKGDTMSDTTLTALPALRLAQLSATVADPSEVPGVIGPLFQRVGDAVTAAGLPIDRPSVATYTGSEDGMLIAAAEQVDAEEVAGVEIVQLPPAEQALTLTHTGSLATIGESWQRLMQAVGERGLSPVGTCREVYTRVDLDRDQDWVVELQQPVE